MPEHIRALVVIVVAAAAVFWIAEHPITAVATQRGDYRRRRNLWFAITLIGFLSHDFWLYMALGAGVLLATIPRERNPIALYVLLLFALPPYSADLPGFGLINYFVSLNHIRLLNLAVLLPAAVRLLGDKREFRNASRWPDLLLALFLGYRFVMQAMVDSFTGDMRSVFELLVDIWLPYYVASRTLRDVPTFRDAMAAFLLSLSIVSVIALFEVARGWLLYEGLRAALDLPPADMLVYLRRGEGGMLRSSASIGNAIALGYVMMIGLAFTVFLAPFLQPRWMRPLAALGMLAGLLAGLSRGPWLGAALALIVALGMGPGAGKRWVRMVAFGGLGIGALLLSPMGDTVIDHLPFIGTVESENITYRQRLFEVSMLVLAQNPMFGAFDYILNPEMQQLRQGQGIIDIVNTYLAVALGYGVVGLVLFVLPFLHALVGCWRKHRAVAARSADAERLGRALMGAMLGVLLTIATVSSITVVPTVYWLMLGMCVAYACRLPVPRSTAVATQARERARGAAAIPRPVS
jgi:O-antigen ligase